MPPRKRTLARNAKLKSSVKKESSKEKELQKRRERLENIKSAVRDAQSKSIIDLENDVERNHLQREETTARSLQQRQKEARELLSKRIASKEGVDYVRAKSLEWSLEAKDDWEKKQHSKEIQKIDDFADKNTAQASRYWRDLAKVKPSAAQYEKSKEQGLNATPIINSKGKRVEPPSQEGLERLSHAISSQQKRASKRSKSRHSANSEINFINDSNARYNRKLARHYDQYTGEIKESLERGTAI